MSPRLGTNHQPVGPESHLGAASKSHTLRPFLMETAASERACTDSRVRNPRIHLLYEDGASSHTPITTDTPAASQDVKSSKVRR
ncbi:unnamed protein product [Rangifer tarandus platyrhynchus]|uniref:Uncharacterized protein n=2 Tax=Rangifer tarandus platyrhynchus TaxID=3082113 RepID=A0ABN8YHP3_RANTA|nr:unnamed protein product [Rangifer tarandus platyrhynchus]CAI9698758.1 unnamed protein product [Rangifer tarandus platyrhynchus]